MLTNKKQSKDKMEVMEKYIIIFHDILMYNGVDLVTRQVVGIDTKY